jgi:hypothetical protein
MFAMAQDLRQIDFSSPQGAAALVGIQLGGRETAALFLEVRAVPAVLPVSKPRSVGNSAAARAVLPAIAEALGGNPVPTVQVRRVKPELLAGPEPVVTVAPPGTRRIPASAVVEEAVAAGMWAAAVVGAEGWTPPAPSTQEEAVAAGALITRDPARQG